MKKRLLEKSRGLKVFNEAREFFNFIESFFYARIIIAIFIFILYFSFSFDGVGLVGKDLFLFGLVFAFIAYSSIFNLARFLFIVKHRMYPLYNGEFDVFNGWLKFDYKDWEKKEANKSSYYMTAMFDIIVFLISFVFLILITVYLL